MRIRIEQNQWKHSLYLKKICPRKANHKLCVTLQLQEKKAKNFLISQRNRKTQASQSFLFLFYDKMSAQEIVLIAEENCIRKQPKPLGVLDDPSAFEKAKFSTVLQRQSLKRESTKETE